jgi:holo-[acyl-carrier protein] synthase
LKTGIDIVSVKRIKDKVGKNPSLAERIFTPGELAYCRSKKDPYPYMAARFAAKEAVYKAMSGLAQGLFWKDMEIISGNEVPLISGDCRVGKYIRENNIEYSLSISHEKEFAVAVFIMAA